MNKNNLLVWLAFICSANFMFATELGEIQEAETSNLSENYTVVNNENASGGSFVKLNKDAPKGVLQFDASGILSNDTYKMEVYSFNGGTAVTLDMSVNGGAATTITLDPSNWAYEGPAQGTLLDVDLISGTNTITFTAVGANVLLDKIIVRDDYDIYYINSAGDDTNDGNISAPWKTLAKASDAAKSQSNGGLLQPGDKILFNRGDSFEGQLIINCSGTEAKPIEIGSYGTGELPIISGSGNIPNGDNIEAVKMTNTSYITVDGIWVKNDRQNMGNITWGTNTSYGIKVIANKWGGVLKGLTFRNLKITDVFSIDMLDWERKFTLDYYTAQGIFFDSNVDHDGTTSPAATEVGIDDVLIEDCFFYNLGSTAISIRSLNPANNPISDDGRNSNYIIRNNHFEKLGGDGVVFASVNKGLVENNEFIDLGWGDYTSQTDLYYGRGEGCWIWDSHNIMVQYNKQYRASGFGDTYGSAGHVDFFCKNAIFQYNYSEDTEGGFVEILGDCENITFRYNVSVNDGHRENGHNRYSIWISGYVGSGKAAVRSDNNFVYNNTVYLDKARSKPDISIYAKNTYIYNNVFKVINGAQIGATGVDIDIASGSELVVSNNLFYGDIATAFTNLDTNKITGQDPKFVNEGSGDIDGYKLQATSQAIDAGKSFPEPDFPMAGQGIFANISLDTATDIYGNAVDIENLLPNIGADNNFNTGIDPNAIRVTGVTVSSQNRTIEAGQTQQLVATITPGNADNQNMNWSSSDPSIATVNQGIVTGVSDGYTTITVTTDDGSFTATTTITIGAEFVINLLNGNFESGLDSWSTWNNPVVSSQAHGGASAIELYDKGAINQWFAVEPNTNYVLSAYLKTSDTAKRVVLGVNDANDNGIESIDIFNEYYTRNQISFFSGSSSTVNVYTWQPPSNNAYAYVDDVQLYKDVPKAVTGVSISSQIGILLVGETQQLSATIAPFNASDQNVSWSSDNSSVASVSQGAVTAQALGTATITVTSDDGGFTASTTITVSPSSIVAFKNGDFEDGLNDWSTWQDVAVSSSGAYEGSSLRNTGVSACNQTVTAKTNTDYILSGYVKVDNPSSQRVVLGVNDANNNGLVYTDITDELYTYHEVAFNSGNNASVTVYFWRPSGGEGAAYLDNAMLIEVLSSSKEVTVKLKTSTNEEENNVSIYPNPTSDAITIDAQGLDGELSIQLYNALGQKVINQTMNTSVNRKKSIPVTQLESGLYVMYLSSDDGYINQIKLVIQ
jgi:uncharacterized protein YjdB